jgi:hypothetical protein
VPEDDRAGDRLLNATIPAVVLPTTAGGFARRASPRQTRRSALSFCGR